MLFEYTSRYIHPVSRTQTHVWFISTLASYNTVQRSERVHLMAVAASVCDLSVGTVLPPRLPIKTDTVPLWHSILPLLIFADLSFFCMHGTSAADPLLAVGHKLSDMSDGTAPLQTQVTASLHCISCHLPMMLVKILRVTAVQRSGHFAQ